MKVHSLFIYPVKSLAGLAVERMSFDDFGPVGDRRWMVVDEQGQFVTQRTHPRLALVKTALVDGEVTINVPGPGTFPLVAGKQRRSVGVWRDRAEAVDELGPASAALSDFLAEPLYFVYMPGDSFRRVDEQRVPEQRRVSFADGFPLLVTSTASLEDLNSRLTTPVEMRRFRPNIVVEGAAAWSEDGWRCLEMGGQQVRLVKPCSRCVLTTVNPDTGQASPDREPLRTLGGFRRTPGGVIFGMNGIHLGDQPVAVGDPVTVL